MLTSNIEKMDTGKTDHIGRPIRLYWNHETGTLSDYGYTDIGLARLSYDRVRITDYEEVIGACGFSIEGGQEIVAMDRTEQTVRIFAVLIRQLYAGLLGEMTANLNR